MEGTALVATTEVEALFRELDASPLLHKGLPQSAGKSLRLDKEFSYDLLLARYASDGVRYLHASLDATRANRNRDDLLSKVNEVLGKTKPTYRHGDVPPRDEHADGGPTGAR